MGTRKDHPVGSPDKRGDKKGKIEEEEMAIVEVEGMPAWAAAMQKNLMQHTTSKVDGLKYEIDEAKAMAMEAQEGVRALRQELIKLKEGSSVDGNPQTLRSLKDLEKEFEKLRVATEGAKEESSAIDKSLEMVFSKFPWNTPGHEIEARIKEVVKEGIGAEPNVVTTRKMTSFGIAKFASSKQKSDFKKWLGDGKKEFKFKGLHTLSIGDNEEKTRRIQGRAVGKVKRALMESRANRTDITTDRNAGEVFVGTERVAKWVGDHFRLKGEALKLKERIDELLAEKRPRDELSEDSL